MPKPRKRGRSGLKMYKSYMFRNKDPVIDELRTIIQDTYGSINYKSLHKIQLDGGPSTSCMDNWFFGETKRPQSASIEACGRAMGMKRVWKKI